MDSMDYLQDRALSHLQALCNRSADRAMGSPGNRAASTYMTRALESLGAQVNLGTYECMDWTSEGARITGPGSPRGIVPSPYSPPVQVTAPLTCVSTLEELKGARAGGKIVLLRGELAAKPLIPRGHPFLDTSVDEPLYQALEDSGAAALLTATPWNPESPGGQYPAPLILDGNFPLASAFLSAEEGDRLTAMEGQTFQLSIRTRRLPSRGSNVCGLIGDSTKPRILLCSTLDSRKDSPGALDNASGLAVLLLAAEILKTRNLKHPVEFLALNGRHHYDAPGFSAYQDQRSTELPLLGVFVACVGLRGEKTQRSCQGTDRLTGEKAGELLGTSAVLAPYVPNWEHRILLDNNIPSVFLSTASREKIRLHAGTPDDKVDQIEPALLTDLAMKLADLCTGL